jgi:hypothetical protein
VKTNKLGNIKVPNSYEEAESLLYYKDGRWAASKKIYRNTKFLRINSGIGLFYRSTLLMKWQENDLLLLDAGHFYTQSTRQRINEWLPNGLELICKGDYWHVAGLLLGDAPFHRGMEIDLKTKSEFSVPFEISDHIIDWNARVIERSGDVILSSNSMSDVSFLIYEDAKNKDLHRADVWSEDPIGMSIDNWYSIMLRGPHIKRGSPK